MSIDQDKVLQPLEIRRTLRRTILPLRLILVGAIFCSFNIYFAFGFGSLVRVDILNDTVGMVLICIGLFKLSAIQVSERYATIMMVVAAIAACLTLFIALQQIGVFANYDLTQTQLILSLVQLVDLLLFCWSMRLLSLYLGQNRLAGSWTTTLMLFFVSYGIFILVYFFTRMSGAKISQLSGPIQGVVSMIVLFMLSAGPLIHLFLSTQRMYKTAQSLPWET